MNYDIMYYKCRGKSSSDEEYYEELKIELRLMIFHKRTF